MRIGWPGHVAADGRQIEFEDTFVFGILQVVRPQAGGFRIVFNQCYLLGFTPCEFEVIDGLFVDVKHAGRSTEFRRHVRNRGTVTDG